MVLQVEVTGTEEVRELLKDIPVNTYEVARAAFNSVALRTHRRVASFSGGLVSRTGRLRRSIIPEVHGTNLKNVGSSVSTKTIYAPIHEEGGTITAKDKYINVPGGPYLNIPLSPNKTAKGVTRQNAREVFQSGGYIVKSKAGKYLVMSSAGTPMFVLVNSVDIPERLGMQQAADDEIPTLLSNLKNTLLKGLE